MSPSLGNRCRRRRGGGTPVIGRHRFNPPNRMAHDSQMCHNHDIPAAGGWDRRSPSHTRQGFDEPALSAYRDRLNRGLLPCCSARSPYGTRTPDLQLEGVRRPRSRRVGCRGGEVGARADDPGAVVAATIVVEARTDRGGRSIEGTEPRRFVESPEPIAVQWAQEVVVRPVTVDQQRAALASPCHAGVCCASRH